MKSDINTTEEIAKRCFVDPCAVRYRAKKLGIKPVQKGHQFYYTIQEAERIVNYKRKKHIYNKIDLKTRFAVIELFLTMKENSCRNISEASDISFSTVSYVINDFLKNGNSIVVESRINYID